MPAFGFGPSLSLGGPARVGFDFTAGVLPPGASLTRASIGSRFDAAGVLRIEAADTARFDHDPVTGAPLGLLIEPARTNEAAMSATLGDAAWAGGGAAIVADAAAAPDGTTSADTIQDSSAGAARFITQTFDAAASRTVSVFVAKDDIGRAMRFMTVRATVGVTDLMVDTKTGALAIAGSVIDGQVRDCGAFWRISSRCDTADQIRFFPAVGAGALSTDQYRVETVGQVTAWGFQAEQGGGATSYIPTAGTPASRAADVLRLDWGRFGIPDGPLAIRTTFDDGSGEEGEAEVVDGHATVPTTLARPWIRRIERR